MMTQQLGFSILTAPVAAIDRRSLSQAWYSALHLARNASLEPPATPKHEAGTLQPRAVTPLRTSSFERKEIAMPRSSRVRIESDRKRAGEASTDRRALRSPLARKIERAFLDPRLHVRHAT